MSETIEITKLKMKFDLAVLEYKGSMKGLIATFDELLTEIKNAVAVSQKPEGRA